MEERAIRVPLVCPLGVNESSSFESRRPLLGLRRHGCRSHVQLHREERTAEELFKVLLRFPAWGPLWPRMIERKNILRARLEPLRVLVMCATVQSVVARKAEKLLADILGLVNEPLELTFVGKEIEEGNDRCKALSTDYLFKCTRLLG